MRKIAFRIQGYEISGFPAIVLIVIFLAFGWSFYFYMSNVVIENRTQERLQKARISNLYTCSKTANKISKESKFLFSVEEQIFLCGFLEADEIVELTIYWIGSNNEVVAQNPFYEKFTPGYFDSELDQKLPPGNYRVDVYYRRNLLGTSKFKIIE